LPISIEIPFIKSKGIASREIGVNGQRTTVP